MLLELKKLLGHRLKLESIARPTLGTGKSADGLQALKWYKEGKLDKIIEYCKVDVEVTRNVYLYAQENGKLHYDSRSGIKTVNLDWNIHPEKQQFQQMSLF
jgi:DEAD/DEAH box helicase domain-containing protein